MQKHNRLFSITFLIIPDAFITESNFLTHLLHKYAILDSSGTVGGAGISGESELQDHYHQKYLSLFIIIPLMRHNYSCKFFLIVVLNCSSPCVLQNSSWVQ